MFGILQAFFSKLCPGCQTKLTADSPLVCDKCAHHLSVALRFDCAVCNRDASGCQLCFEASNIERILVTFEKTAQLQRTLEKAHFVSGWRLHLAIASSMWLRLLSSGAPEFQYVSAASCLKGKLLNLLSEWKRVPLNKILSKAIAKEMKSKNVSLPFWRVRIAFQKEKNPSRLLIVAACLSEKEMLAIARKWQRVDPDICLTFLIGYWK